MRRPRAAGAPSTRLRRRVPPAAGAAELAAPDAGLQRAPEPHRAPVLAAQRVADVALGGLAALLPEVLDQRDLTVEPPLVLVAVLRRGRGEWGEAVHRGPPLVVSPVS